MENIEMSKEKYWKVIKYSINREYNKKYPLHAIVTINGEVGEHLWLLPEECLKSDSYDWSNAKKVNNLFGDN